MKKAPIFKTLAAGGALYAAAGFLGVPYVVQNILPEKVSQMAGGAQLSVAAASFNPFSFRLGLEGVTFKTPGGEELFALAALSADADPTRFFTTGGWHLKQISLTAPRISIRRDGAGDFNFAFLLGGGEDGEAREPSPPPALFIERFVLREGGIDYRDDAGGKSYILGIGPVGFALENIDLRDLSGGKGKMRLYASINDGGFVDIDGQIETLSPLVVDGNVSFDSGKLYTLWRYFRDRFPIEVADGKTTFGFRYRFDSGDVNATELSGLNAQVSGLRIIPSGEARNILAVRSLRLEGGSVFPMLRRFSADSLAADGIYASATRSADGSIDWLRHIERILEIFPEDENETKEPWEYRIGGVSVEKAQVQWNDRAPAVPYRVSLSGGGVQTGPLRSDPRERVEFSASTAEVRMERLGDGAPVASLKAIRVDGGILERESRFADVSKVSALSPEISLKRLKDGSLDVTRHLYASPPADEASSEGGWGYRIGEIALLEGRAALRDELPRRAVSLNLDRLNASLRDFSSDPKGKNAFELAGRLNAQSTFMAKGELVRSPLRSQGTFDLSRLDPAIADPYLEPSTHASLRRGDFSVGGTYDYTPKKASVKGKISLSDWVVNDARDGSVLLGWRRIGATPFSYAYPDNRLKINQLSIDGLYTNALIDADKVLNYATLSKSLPSFSPPRRGTAKEASNPFGLEVTKLLVRNSSATFSDLSLPLPFKTYIHGMEGSVMGISTLRDVTTFVKLRGEVDEYGLARIDGSLNSANPKRFTDLKVAFENLELPSYTPYSLQFLGYHIAGGKLSLDLGYKIDEGALRGENNVLIRRIELGEEKEGGSPWPLRLVVALLEDSEGVIDVALPVQGDVNNPEFRYGSVVWQVIKNLLTKAVTAPFRMLGALLGIEDESLESVGFEGGSYALLPPQREKLDNVARVLQKRPKLSLEISGGWDEKEDGYALRGEKLVASAKKRDKKLEADSPEAIPLELLEEMAEEAFKRKELRSLRNDLEEKYPEEAAYVRHYGAALIEKLIVKQPLAPGELENLGARRAETIRSYLAGSPGLEKRIVVQEAAAAEASGSREVPSRLSVFVP